MRAATLADLPQLAALFDAYRRFYGKQGDAPTSHDFIRQRLIQADSHVLVYQQQGQLLGFTQLLPLLSSVLAAPVWLLNDLYVVEAARQRGVGQALLQAAAALARQHGVQRLDLVTAVDNHTAQALYAGQGWQRDERFYRYQLTLG
ncbi:MAG: GNAT family N-acetyltransferase [Vogesella sp.]|nr:GNAT family N-acetyltransferase [Vogesella sp.]